MSGRIDPIEKAVDEARSSPGNLFGAPRELDIAPERRITLLHPGIDLGLREGTPIRAPAENMVLVGVTEWSTSGAGYSTGNMLVFFVPGRNPFFLALMHLSGDTVRLYGTEGRFINISPRIGQEISADQIVALSGSTAAGGIPHLHVTATRKIQVEKTIYDAETFNAKGFNGNVSSAAAPGILQAGTRAQLLNIGYLDPMGLIDSGKLRLSSAPRQVLPPEAEQRKAAAR